MVSTERVRHTALIAALASSALVLATGCPFFFFACWDGSVMIDVSGRIVDANTSEPSIEAEIAVRLYDDRGTMLTGFAGPPEDGATATTVEDGSFSLRYPGAPAGGCGRDNYSLPIPDVVRVEVDVLALSGAVGEAVLIGDQIVQTEGSIEFGDIVVMFGPVPCIDNSRFFDISGRVVDETTAAPIAAAEVSVSLYDDDYDLLTGFRGPPPQDVIAITDEDGSFSLEYPFPVAGECGTDLSLQALPDVARARVRVNPLTGTTYSLSIPVDQIVRTEDSLDLGDIPIAVGAAP